MYPCSGVWEDYKPVKSNTGEYILMFAYVRNYVPLSCNIWWYVSQYENNIHPYPVSEDYLPLSCNVWTDTGSDGWTDGMMENW